MQRSLKVKRIYSLGAYQNIEISDEITEIPEAMASNEELMSRLFQLMALALEIKISKYYQIRETTKNMTPEEVVQQLEDQRDTLMQSMIEKVDVKNAE